MKTKALLFLALVGAMAVARGEGLNLLDLIGEDETETRPQNLQAKPLAREPLLEDRFVNPVPSVENPIERKPVQVSGVQKVIEKRVVVERPVERIVEKPVERIVEKVVEKPVERIVEKVVEKPVMVEKEVTNTVERIVEKVVEKPVMVERPVTNTIERIVEKVVEKPVMVEKEVTNTVERIVEREVVVEKEVTNTVEKIVEKVVEKPVIVEKKVIVEVPVEKPVVDKDSEQRLLKQLEEERALNAHIKKTMDRSAVLSQTGRVAKITSASTYYDRKNGFVIFDRNVHVDDAQYQLHADKAYVFLDATNDVRRLVAIGHVAMTNGTKRAYGSKASYYRKSGMVILYAGDGVVAEVRDSSKGEDQVVRGSKIKFWIDSEQVEVLNADISAPRSGGAGLKDILPGGGKSPGSNPSERSAR